MTQRISDFDWAIGHTGATWVKDPDLNVKQLTDDNVTANEQRL